MTSELYVLKSSHFVLRHSVLKLFSPFLTPCPTALFLGWSNISSWYGTIATFGIKMFVGGCLLNYYLGEWQQSVISINYFEVDIMDGQQKLLMILTNRQIMGQVLHSSLWTPRNQHTTLANTRPISDFSCEFVIVVLFWTHPLRSSFVKRWTKFKDDWYDFFFWALSPL